MPAYGQLTDSGAGQFGTLSTRGLQAGGDFSSQNYDDIRNSTINALRSRQDESFAQDRQALETDLRNKGIGQGSEAWRRAFDDFGEQINDARLQADLAGTADARSAYDQYLRQQGAIEGQRAARFGERSAVNADADADRMNEMALRQMINADQDADRSMIFNERDRTQADKDADRTREFGINSAVRDMLLRDRQLVDADRDAFAGQARQDRTSEVNAANSLRAAMAAENRDLQSYPINRATALLSGSQITPTQIAAPQAAFSPMANTDVAGIINQGYGNQLAAAQANNQFYSDLYGGLFGFGGNVLGGAFGGGYI